MNDFNAEAFGNPPKIEMPSLTKRELFTLLIAQGLLSGQEYYDQVGPNRLVELTSWHVDALLKELEKKEDNK